MKSAYNVAIKWLAKRDYTSFEILKKLQNKGFSKEEILKVIKKLKNEKIIDDEKTLINFVKKKIEKNLYGPYVLHNILLSKGVPEMVINNILNKINQEFFINSAIKHIRKKRLSKNKIFSYLKNKGFEIEKIEKIINKINYDFN